MLTRLSLSPVALACLIFLANCAGSPIAEMTASVDAAGTSALANLKFHSFDQPSSGSSSDLHLQFSNSEGDSMIFTLAPVNGTFPTDVSYKIDGSTNTFNSTFTVIAAGAPQTISVEGRDGHINVTGLAVDGTNVSGITGNFRVDLYADDALVGAAQGVIGYTPD